jgi:hypothetical protein
VAVVFDTKGVAVVFDAKEVAVVFDTKGVEWLWYSMHQIHGNSHMSARLRLSGCGIRCIEYTWNIVRLKIFIKTK